MNENSVLIPHPPTFIPGETMAPGIGYTFAYDPLAWTIRFKKLDPRAIIPTRATEQSAGLDLYAIDAVTLAPGERKLVKTGLAMVLPSGTEGQVRPRSGLALKHGITVLNAPGTIDADYRGEVGALLVNHGSEPFAINPGDRIAQLVVAPTYIAPVHEVAELPSTDRGAGGFGSTGR
jgi:dUTP pyrophosphatase